MTREQTTDSPRETYGMAVSLGAMTIARACRNKLNTPGQNQSTRGVHSNNNILLSS